MKDKLLFGFVIALLFVQFNTRVNAQPSSCNPAGCTANDLTVTAYRIADISGNDIDVSDYGVGEDIPGAYLWVTIVGNPGRYNLFYSLEVIISGVSAGTLSGCWNSGEPFNEIPVGEEHRLSLFDYNAGESIELRNIYLSWGVNKNAACGCNKPHCASTPSYMLYTSALTPGFTYAGSCGTSGLSFEEITFTDHTLGGTMPYSYNWTFGTGATPSQSTLQNPVVTYATGGQKTVVLLVTDADGTTATVSQTLSVAPCCNLSISAPDDVSIECDESTEPANTGTAVASNNGVLLTASHSDVIIPGDNASEYVINRTWSVSNLCDQTLTDVQVITVSDNTAPSISVPPDVTLEANVGITYVGPIGEASASDNCDQNVTISNNAPAAFPLGFTTVIWTATDASGNTTTGTQTVEIIDITPVSLDVCAPDQFGEADASCQAEVPDFTASLIDLLPEDGNTYTVTQSPVAGTTVNGAGLHEIILTVTDQSGNETTCGAFFIVEDATLPQLTVPADFTAATNQGCTYVGEFGQATATDNCESTVDITNDAPAAFPIGTTVVIWTATDASGLSVSGSQTVTIQDEDAPVISGCPADLVVQGNENDLYEVPDFVTSLGMTITDNCSTGTGLTITQVPAAGTILGLGEFSVTITVKDAAGNESVCSFSAIVETIITTDFVVCPGVREVEAMVCFGECTAIVPDFRGEATFSDDIASLVQEPAPGTWIKGNGFHTVVLTATDDSGNTSVCETGMMVYSVAIEGCEPALVEVTSGCSGSVPDLRESISLTSLCGEVLPENELQIVQSPAPGTVLGIGQYVLTFSVKNAQNKVVTSCSTTLTIADVVAPVVNCAVTPVVIKLKAQVVMDRFGVWTVYKNTLPGNLISATDNCTPSAKLTVTFSQTVFTQADLGFKWVTAQIADASGNISTCNIPVSVIMPLKNGEIGTKLAPEENRSLSIDVQVYPNPTTGKMWIRTDNLNDPRVSAKLFNASGSVVFDGVFTGGGAIELDLTGHVDGIYLLKVVADNNEFNHKIILQKR